VKWYKRSGRGYIRGRIGREIRKGDEIENKRFWEELISYLP
jgi:hypothetical protein